MGANRRAEKQAHGAAAEPQVLAQKPRQLSPPSRPREADHRLLRRSQARQTLVPMVVAFTAMMVEVIGVVLVVVSVGRADLGLEGAAVEGSEEEGERRADQATDPGAG